MPSINRIDDVNTAQGKITSTPQSSVFANGKLISVDGASGTPDTACSGNNIHCNWKTANGVSNVFAEGKPVNVKGNQDSCSHARSDGSVDVFAG